MLGFSVPSANAFDAKTLWDEYDNPKRRPVEISREKTHRFIRWATDHPDVIHANVIDKRRGPGAGPGIDALPFGSTDSSERASSPPPDVVSTR